MHLLHTLYLLHSHDYGHLVSGLTVANCSPLVKRRLEPEPAAYRNGVKDLPGFHWLSSAGRSLLLPVDVAEHVGMNVEAEVGEVVEVFAGHEPDDFADGAFGVEAGHAGEGAGLDLLVSGEFGDIVERGAFGVGEQRTVAIPVERIEF